MPEKVNNKDIKNKNIIPAKGRLPEKSKKIQTGVKETKTPIRNLAPKVSAHNNELREKDEQILNLANRIKKLESQKKGLEKQISTCDNDLQVKTEQNSNLKSNINEAKSEIENLKQEGFSYANQTQEKDSQITKLTNTVKTRESKIKKLSQEKSDLNQRVDYFENQLREKTEQNSKLESDIDKAKSEIEKLGQGKSDLNQRVDYFENQLREKTEQNSKLESDINKAKSEIEKLSQENSELNQDIVNRDNKLQDTEKTLEEFRAAIENLTEQSKKDKVIVAQEWARGLTVMLRKVSNLAGREPQNMQGLTPRAVYEDLLTWMEKTYSEKPRPFPNGEIIELDANSEDILELKSRYDWGAETPFAEGSRKKTFRIIQRGWKLKTEILLPAVVTTEQPGSEVSHE